MKNISVFIMLLFTFAVTAQLEDTKLRQNAFQTAERYSLFLSLDKSKQNEVYNILVKYDLKLPSAIKNSTSYFDAINENDALKNQELKKVLGERNYQNYLRLSKIDQSSAEQYYAETLNSLKNNEALIQEFSGYAVKYILPVLSHLRLEFDEEISITDRREIDGLRAEIYNQIGNEGEVSEKLTELAKYVNMYDDLYQNTLIGLEGYANKWEKDLKSIIDKYYTSSQLIAMDYGVEKLGKTNILKTINNLSFLLIDPYDKNKFFVNLSLMASIRNRLLFEK